MTKFVPDDFVVPLGLEHADFRLEILKPDVNDLDYEAVMSSRENLHRIFAERDEWPADNMTPEENLSDLMMHEKEFKDRKAFAYTVLTQDKSKCIGCIYIEPCRKDEFDSEVYFWIRDDSIQFEPEFEKTIKKWLEDIWPFTRITFPGRDVSWKKWGKRSHNHI